MIEPRPIIVIVVPTSLDDLFVIHRDRLTSRSGLAATLGLFLGLTTVVFDLLGRIRPQVIEHVERNAGLDQHRACVFVARELAADDALGVDETRHGAGENKLVFGELLDRALDAFELSTAKS
jgi:hypothetical protein